MRPMLNRQGCLLFIHHSREQGMPLCMTNSFNPYLLTICSVFGNNTVCSCVLGIEQWADQTLFGSNRTIISVMLKKKLYGHTHRFSFRELHFTQSNDMTVERPPNQWGWVYSAYVWGSMEPSLWVECWPHEWKDDYVSMEVEVWYFYLTKIFFYPQKSIQSPFEFFLALNSQL